MSGGAVRCHARGSAVTSPRGSLRVKKQKRRHCAYSPVYTVQARNFALRGIGSYRTSLPKSCPPAPPRARPPLQSCTRTRSPHDLTADIPHADRESVPAQCRARKIRFIAGAVDISIRWRSRVVLLLDRCATILYCPYSPENMACCVESRNPVPPRRSRTGCRLLGHGRSGMLAA